MMARRNYKLSGGGSRGHWTFYRMKEQSIYLDIKKWVTQEGRRLFESGKQNQKEKSML